MTETVSPARLELARYVRAGDTVVWAQACAEPVTLTSALLEQRAAIGPFRCFLGIGVAPTARPEHADVVSFTSYCGTGSNRALADAGVLDILPCHYSDLPRILTRGPLRADVVLLTLPPARDGRYSFGIAHEYLSSALSVARVVLAEVSDAVPWTPGGAIDAGRVDVAVPTDRSPVELGSPASDDVTARIADHVASLVEDGSVLQFGIGALPNLVAQRLADRRHLRIHSGAVVEAVVDMAKAGALATGGTAPAIVGGALFGGERLFRFAHANAELELRDTARTHAVEVTSALARFVAVNSAIEVDLLGQANTEVARGSYAGAVGGALDFARGANRSAGGVPVVGLPSTAGPRSRIVAELSGPCTIPRADAGVVVTEHGIADLRSASASERASQLVQVAHPDHRRALELAIEERFRHPAPRGGTT